MNPGQSEIVGDELDQNCDGLDTVGREIPLPSRSRALAWDGTRLAVLGSGWVEFRDASLAPVGSVTVTPAPTFIGSRLGRFYVATTSPSAIQIANLADRTYFPVTWLAEGETGSTSNWNFSADRVAFVGHVNDRPSRLFAARLGRATQRLDEGTYIQVLHMVRTTGVDVVVYRIDGRFRWIGLDDSDVRAFEGELIGPYDPSSAAVVDRRDGSVLIRANDTLVRVARDGSTTTYPSPSSLPLVETAQGPRWLGQDATSTHVRAYEWVPGAFLDRGRVLDTLGPEEPLSAGDVTVVGPDDRALMLGFRILLQFEM
ncbi:MAG: hypothetical protein R3B99_00155 [Polyangiales bacterium]